MGGLAGFADDYSQTTKMTNVSSSVDINDFSDGQDNDSYFEYVGGIVGSATAIVINNATFSGSLFGNESVGGILGYGEDAFINNATVTEDVEIEAEEEMDAYDIAGIVGELDSNSSLNNVSFAGSITVDLDASAEFDYDASDIAGIVGDSYDSNIVGATVYDTADISVVGYDTGSQSIGGIVGLADETSISSSANHADLIVSEVYRVGGIVGEMEQSVVTGSLNTGEIVVTIDDDSSDFSDASVGGIVGYIDFESEISTSANKGNVTVDGADDAWGVGGIVGHSDGEGNTILDNYNTGDITGVYNVAGVIGYVDHNWTQIERNYSLGKLTAYDSDPDGIATIDSEDGYIVEPSNAVLLSDRADNVTEAMELTAAELKAGLDLVDAGWTINLQGGSESDDAKWKTVTDFNSGYPSLVWETVSDDYSEPIGLSDNSFGEVVQFDGGKRFRLTLEERNALNAVANAINEHEYDSVDVDVYYGSKFKLAGKRAKAVKRYLVRRFVGDPISVHILPADGGHAVGSVHITALVD